jgi:hypothetical protein
MQGSGHTVLTEALVLRRVAITRGRKGFPWLRKDLKHTQKGARVTCLSTRLLSSLYFYLVGYEGLGRRYLQFREP